MSKRPEEARLSEIDRADAADAAHASGHLRVAKQGAVRGVVREDWAWIAHPTRREEFRYEYRSNAGSNTFSARAPRG